MKAAQIASVVSAAAASGTLTVTWKDCGDASTHSKITDLQPSSINIGEETTITGTGDLDMDVSGGKFNIKLVAGGGLVRQSYDGDVCSAKQFSLPLGMGSISWGGLACPLSAGAVQVPMSLHMAASIPASLANADITASGTTSTGEKLMCAAVSVAKQGETVQMQDGVLAVTWKDCGDSSTHSKITDLQPPTITIGKDTTITGTGALDTDVDGGEFNIKLVAGGGLVRQTYTGDVCAAKQFNLPLGMGSISWGGMSCPLSAGTLQVPMSLHLAASIPASLANADITASGTTNSGDKLMCAAVSVARQSQEVQVADGVLAVTWKDCGDASTHGKISDLQPPTITIGEDTTITGTGVLDADFDGGSFNVKLVAGGGLVRQTFTGDVCAAKQFDLPLGMGSIAWGGMSCPLSAGTLTVPMSLHMASSIPARLANAEITASGSTNTGEKLMCAAVSVSKQADIIV